MSDAIVGLIGSVIVAVLTLIGVIYQSRKANEAVFAKLDKQSELADTRLDAKLEKYQAVTDTKIEELTREVRNHNEFATRVPLLEAEDKRLNERLKALENRAS
jgi:chaperonin cofactor prefoldin